MIQKFDGWLMRLGVEWFWYHGAGWVQKRRKRGKMGWCFYTRRCSKEDGGGRGKYLKAHQIVVLGRLWGCYFD